MGTDAAVVVLGPTRSRADALAARAEQQIVQLERRWSRFVPTSEVSRLNAARRGVPVIVSDDTARLVALAVDAWRITDGAFDPTVHDALRALGYDRTFAELAPPDAPVVVTDGHGPTPGAGGISVDPVLRAVWLPDGVSFDPGGIGKGFAADLVATAIVAAGANGALVDLGGDIRCCGDGPADGAWVVEIDAALPLPRLALRDAGVATSSTRRRRWQGAGGTRHHLIDPSTGGPADVAHTDATAIAPTAWLAEAATKAALVRGRTDVHPAVHVVLHGERGATGPLLQELHR